MSITDILNISIIITVQGDNHYATVRTTPENIVFYSENVDRAGRKTKLVYVVGKNAKWDRCCGKQSRSSYKMKPGGAQDLAVADLG